MMDVGQLLRDRPSAGRNAHGSCFCPFRHEGRSCGFRLRSEIYASEISDRVLAVKDVY
jgi:hypothetical protein